MSMDRAQADAARYRQEAIEMEQRAKALLTKADLLDEFIKQYSPAGAAPTFAKPVISPSPAARAGRVLRPAANAPAKVHKRDKITPDTAAAIVRQAQAGVRRADIAKNLGVSIGSVNNHIHKHEAAQGNGNASVQPPHAEPALPNMPFQTS